MVKNKQNMQKGAAKKQEAKVKKNIQKHKENEGHDDYDSMIENGTSDDDSDMEAEAPSEDDNNGSDDGFSEQDETGNKKGGKEPKQPIGVAPAAKRKSGTAPDAATVAAAKKPSKKQKLKPNAVKPPTLEEINELKETRNLFHSNLFRLQVKEMLAELKIKEKYTKYICSWLEQFKSFMHALASQSEKEDVDKLKWLQACPLQVPLSLQNLRVHHQQQKTFQFQFIKPSAEPYLIGAAATQTLLGPQLVADVCIAMPTECFQKENYLNLVYDQKRALYLTYIGAQLLRSKQWPEGVSAEQLRFNYNANNPLKAVLEVRPRGTLAKLTMRIHVAADEASFKLNRFVPWNNNVRAQLFGDEEEVEPSTPLATPAYNASVLFDLCMHRNQRLLHECFGPNVNFQQGLVLLKVWLRQRQLDVGYSGFGSHVLALFIVYLFKQRKLHANMSSYQVARNVWNQLAHSAWDEREKGITLCPSNAASMVPNQPTVAQFHAHYDVVFVDVTGFHNVCAQLSLELYRHVRNEAKLAVDMLNDMQLNSFQLIFMTKFPIFTRFDHVLKINKSEAAEQILEMHVKPEDKYNNAGYAYPQLLKAVTSLLRQGLGKRVHTLLPFAQASEAWAVNDPAPAATDYLHLGIILDPEHAYEVLDRGPESIAEDAEAFRQFWGEKAQLRRFQDGSITESVVWASSSDAIAKKRLVVRSIVLYLLQHHMQLEVGDVEYIGGELDLAYRLTPAFKTDKLYDKVAQDTDAEAVSLEAIRCFDDLARKLHALNELPLEIVSIAGISPLFRYCEPAPVLPVARCINENFHSFNVHRGVIQLGLSGKWPSELTALRALKAAFYIQIAQMLRSKYRLRTRVTFDGVLVLKRGYCFVLELAHPKEVALLKEEKTTGRSEGGTGLTKQIDSAASVALERRHYVLPRVSGALHALHQLHSSYGGSVMIAKRWLYAQLIDDGLWPDECTELLMASLFLRKGVQAVPCSPQLGFVRLLQLLANSEWRTELVLLNFNNAMDENEIGALEQRFNAKRDTFPPLCVATSYDLRHHGHLWTSPAQPNVHVLARVTLLARGALALIEPGFVTRSPFVRPARFFSASNVGYDLVLQLKPEIVPNTLATEFGSPFLAKWGKPCWRLPLAGSNYIQEVVAKLREGYSDYAAFFYNPCGGKEIAIIWKPQPVFAAKEFKVNDVNGCSLTTSNRIQCRKEILVEDFKFMLKDFFLRVDTVEAVWAASNETDDKPRHKNANMSQRYFAHKLTETTTEPDAQQPVKEKIEQMRGKRASKDNRTVGKKSKTVQLQPKIKLCKQKAILQNPIINTKGDDELKQRREKAAGVKVVKPTIKTVKHTEKILKKTERTTTSNIVKPTTKIEKLKTPTLIKAAISNAHKKIAEAVLEKMPSAAHHFKLKTKIEKQLRTSKARSIGKITKLKKAKITTKTTKTNDVGPKKK